MRDILKHYKQPAFLICVFVLAFACGSQTYIINKLGVQLIKLPIPLKDSLENLDSYDLSPYKVAKKHRIKNKDILENLGTEEYIQWDFEDTSVAKDSALRHCFLFITYYTGNPDQVPHVPDECYTGGGNQRLARDQVSLDLKLTDPGAEKTISAKYLVFSQKSRNIWQQDSKFSVMYFFHVNGQYSGTRTETRKIMGKNLFGKYSYFAKVEWKFYGRNRNSLVYPDKEDALAASEKFLSVLLTVMDKDIWPDWENANSKD